VIGDGKKHKTQHLKPETENLLLKFVGWVERYLIQGRCWVSYLNPTYESQT